MMMKMMMKLLAVCLILWSQQTASLPVPPDAGPELSYGEYNSAAVTSQDSRCNDIGRVILEEGGSAVDAAIAGLLCLGVVAPHHSGIGGGFLMTIYDRGVGDTHKVVRALNAREVAPLAATEDMYIDSDLSSTLGGSAVAVPGQVAGLKAAHHLYGRLPWKRLFQPAINLAKKSHVSESLAYIFKINAEVIKQQAGLSDQYLNKSGEVFVEGDVIKQKKLAKTMQTIAKEGAEAFYTGSLAEDIVADIADEGGIITEQDLADYEAVWKQAVATKLLDDTQTAYGPPPPSSAIVVAFILNIIEGYDMDSSTPEDLRRHRLAEAMKFAYAKRSLLGDADFADDIPFWIDRLTSPDYADSIRDKIVDSSTSPDIEFYEPAFDIVQDSGTSQLSVLAPDGGAVSVTSTVNLYFGSKVRGSRTGIVFNNQMDDFSTPGTSNSFGVPSSPQNYIVPGKRPMSSMSPMILVDDDGVVRSVLGAAGGTRIITAITQSIINSQFYGMRIDEAVAEIRIHHQLLPPQLKYEEGLPQAVQTALEERGHELKKETPHRWFGSCMAIVNKCPACGGSSCVQATADYRSNEGGTPPQTAGF